MTSQKAYSRQLGLSDLDRPAVYPDRDPSGLRERLRTLPEQCRQAWQATQSSSCPLERLAGDYDQVVIGGMGGSAIAGDLVVDLAGLQSTPPIVVVRSFQLPFALTRRSLFIPCSYSGNTQETWSMFEQACASGAQVLVIAGGGKLATAALEEGMPFLPVAAPGEPRSAIGYHLTLLLGALNRLDLLRTTDGEVAAAVESLRRQLVRIDENRPSSDNPAKQLAGQLLNRLAIVYGGGLFSGVARRWKGQLNENAKVWAFCETIPEVLHGSVEAYGSDWGGGQEGQDILALLLEPSQAEAQLQERYRALTELLTWGGINHWLAPTMDGPPLAQLLNMILLGDYVSYYLALLRGINPSPTPLIDRGKALLPA